MRWEVSSVQNMPPGERGGTNVIQITCQCGDASGLEEGFGFLRIGGAMLSMGVNHRGDQV